MDDTATVHYATHTSPEAIDAVGALAGSGARTVTITVDDGTDPVQGARVRLTKGAESYLVSTDADGLAEFLLDDGTWTVTITLALYTFTSTTLVVDGNETVTYSMSAVAVSAAANADFSTGTVLCHDQNGDVEEGRGRRGLRCPLGGR